MNNLNFKLRNIASAGFLVMLFCVSLSAQQRKTDPNRLYQRPKYIAKFSASNLMDVYNPAIQIGLEQFFNTKNSLQYEIGGIWAQYPYDALSYGFNLRTEYRHYFLPIAAGDANNYFHTIQANWRQTFTNRFDWVDRFDGAFSENIQYNNRRNIATLSYNAGCLWYFTPNLIFEAGFGLGIRMIQVRNIGLPEDAVFLENNFDFPFNPPPEEADYFRLAVNFNLKIGRVF